MASTGQNVIAADRVGEEAARRIYGIRGQQIMLDYDLASFYGVSTKQLMQQVRRNLTRFPEDFMFQLTNTEYADLRSHFVTANLDAAEAMRLSKRRSSPYAFTEHGAVALAGVLRSERAAEVNVLVVRAYVSARRRLEALAAATPAELIRSIEAIKEDIGKLRESDTRHNEVERRLVETVSGLAPLLEVIANDQRASRPPVAANGQRQLKAAPADSAR